MVRRVTTSLNVEPLHLEWLKSQPGGMAEHINRYVKQCILMEHPEENVEQNEIKTKIEKIREKEVEAVSKDEERIRKFIRSKPGRLETLKKDSSIVTKSYLTALQGATSWDNPQSMVSINRLRAILKEEVDAFDEAAYLSKERERHDNKG